MSTPDDFWAGEFGTEYAKRNNESLDRNKREMFYGILPKGEPWAYVCNKIVEYGCSSGGNLRAIAAVFPWSKLYGCEINPKAVEMARELGTPAEITRASIFDYQPPGVCDLALSAGLLIHIHPDRLPDAYEALYRATRKYILLIEYYNPTPVEIPYRGHAGRLWKRDFAGEMMDRYGLQLEDYGFIYHRDEYPQDDVTWFLLEKV
jgi:pseudaminic acid biosynthesis-associated methylase